MNSPFVNTQCSTTPVDCGGDTPTAASETAINLLSICNTVVDALLGGGGSEYVATAAVPKQMTPLDLTYVVYDSSSISSTCLAYITLIPLALLVGLFSSIYLRRDLESCYHTTGLILSTAINFILKRTFKQARPIGSVKTGYGFPSDHAQFSFFFLVYTAIWLSLRVNMPRRQKFFTIFLMFIVTLLICYSRIHLGVHTWIQIFAGAGIGSFLGFIWAAWARVCVWKHIFPLIESSIIGRTFYLKDCSNTPPSMSMQEWEYQMYIKQRKNTYTKTTVTGEVAEIVPLPFHMNGNGNGNGVHK